MSTKGGKPLEPRFEIGDSSLPNRDSQLFHHKLSSCVIFSVKQCGIPIFNVQYAVNKYYYFINY